ncbi:hypothetical protein niasHS_010428 [Heterodera schachtii]|uniref:CCHC-type domain-containing protein n=1 Tax=Heterodera schachtii TaxID=97005 RepID=A0ABD2IZS1_HETSC
MRVIRTPPLTRTRALNHGIVVDRDGNAHRTGNFEAFGNRPNSPLASNENESVGNGNDVNDLERTANRRLIGVGMELSANDDQLEYEEMDADNQQNANGVVEQQNLRQNMGSQVWDEQIGGVVGVGTVNANANAGPIFSTPHDSLDFGLLQRDLRLHFSENLSLIPDRNQRPDMNVMQNQQMGHRRNNLFAIERPQPNSYRMNQQLYENSPGNIERSRPLQISRPAVTENQHLVQQNLPPHAYAQNDDYYAQRFKAQNPQQAPKFQNHNQNAPIRENHLNQLEQYQQPVHPGLVFDGMMAQAIRSLDSFSYTMTLNSIPNLDSTSGSDAVNAFFKQFDVATEEWPEHKRLRALRSKCFGKAERAFNSAISENPHEYQLIRRIIIRQLDDTDAKQLTSFDQLMRGIRRRPNESVDELGNRISGLVRRAYPGLTEQQYDDYSIMHFIRAISNPELAITLEMTRRPGATFDEFIAQAARAEATQSAARNSFRSNQTFQRQMPNSSYSSNNVPSNNYTSNWSRPEMNTNKPTNVTCFNCGRIGHVSRNCMAPPKSRPFQENQNQFSKQPGTGANTAPLNWNRQAPIKSGQQFPASRNFLRQNYLVEQNNEPQKRNDLLAGAVNAEYRPQIENFFLNAVNELSDIDVSNESPLVGKIIVAKVSVYGRQSDAMLDGGAQISLI